MSETILQEAQRLVHGDRGAAYGHPIEDYTRTGRMWAAILDGWLRKQPGFEDMPPVPDVDPRIGTLMMAAVKISREVNAPKRDNRTDLAGYAECCDMVATEQDSRRRPGVPDWEDLALPFAGILHESAIPAPVKVGTILPYPGRRTG